MKLTEAEATYLADISDQIAAGRMSRETLKRYRSGLHKFGRYLSHRETAKAEGLNSDPRSPQYAVYVARVSALLAGDGYVFSGWPDLSIDDIDWRIIGAYTSFLRGSTLVGASQRGCLHSVRGMFAFHTVAYHADGTSTGFLPENPCKRVRLPPKNRPFRFVPTSKQIKDLIGACDAVPSKRRRLLARAVLNLLYWGLLRSVVDLCQLRLSDYDPDRETLLVRNSKGGSTRTIPVPKNNPAFKAALDAWHALRMEEEAKIDAALASGKLDVTPGLLRARPFLFTHGTRKRFESVGISHLFEEVKRYAGLDDMPKFTPHCLRTAGVLEYDRRKMPTPELQDLCGHALISTTLGYLKTQRSAETKREFMDGFDPPDAKPGAAATKPAPTPPKPIAAGLNIPAELAAALIAALPPEALLRLLTGGL